MLFRRKPKEAILYVKLMNGSDCIFEGKVIELPLSEEILIRKSIDFFSDPTPCHIHKGAVMARLYEEIGVFAKNNLHNENLIVPFEAIPDEIKCYIDFTIPYTMIISQ